MYAISWLVFLILGIAVYVWYIIEKRKYKDVGKIPGPPVKFLFGNSLEFGNNLVDVFYNTHRLVKEYGPLVRIWQGPFNLQLFVTDPATVEYFLGSNVHITKSDGYKFFHPWLGYGLLTSTGQKWRMHRKIITPAFHFKVLEQFPEYFARSGKILIRKLKEKQGEPVDIHDYIKLYTLDVLCESSLKIQLKAQESSDNKLLLATEGFVEIFIKRSFSMLMRHDFMFRFTMEYRKMNKHVAYLRKFTQSVIQQRKKERNDISDNTIDDFGIKKKKAFVDVLLDSNRMSDVEIREQVDTFFAAGHETVAAGISFGLFELAKHPHVQKQILDEVHEVAGFNRNSEITLKHLQEMKYLDCVMKEILRMHPPILYFGRQLEEDIVLDGIRIPRGTMVTFLPYSQHRNEKYFSEPESFKPERFLIGDVEKNHPFAMIPFSAGPRNCIGSKYALMNCKTAIVNVIRNFELIAMKPKHEPILANATVMKSMNGLPVILKFRD